jgi:hypothetical protein
VKRTVYQVHSLADPALSGITGTQAVKYGMSRNTGDLPKLTEQPTTYHFRRMKRGQRYFAEGATTDVERHDRAFMAAVVKIEGGHFGEPWEPDGVNDPERVAMTIDELNHLEDMLSPAEISDVGMVAYVRSMLSPKAAPRYPRPRTSLDAWDALHRPSAEPIPEDAPQSNEALKAV